MIPTAAILRVIALFAVKIAGDMLVKIAGDMLNLEVSQVSCLQFSYQNRQNLGQNWVTIRCR